MILRSLAYLLLAQFVLYVSSFTLGSLAVVQHAPCYLLAKKATETETLITSEKTVVKKQTTTTTKRKKKQQEILHWRSSTDAFEYQTGRLLRFTVRGEPKPLRRHRTSRGFMYNPSAKAQESFRDTVLALLKENGVSFPFDIHPTDNVTTTTTTPVDHPQQPLFPVDTPLVVSAAFWLKRPTTHFVGNKRCKQVLRSTAPSCTATTRTDVDNLAKFVLDSLNGVLYADDKQVVSLHVTKLLDNKEECRGSTDVYVRVLSEEAVSSVLHNSFHF